MESLSSISNREIKEQLNRILLFPTFCNSMILSQFLSFIVEETLAGKSHLIKEYTIGISVLLKKTAYDPQHDASVRIHAGRLRKALADYYNGPGLNDSILISVPKGGYIPTFDTVKSPEIFPKVSIPEAIYKPSLAVLPFYFSGANELQTFADGLCDQICTEFTNFSELTVVSYYSSRKIASEAIDLKEAAMLLDATFLLTGSIQSSENQIRIRVQLIQSNNQHQIWACSYEKDKSALDNFVIQDDIVRHVINQIGGSHGIIFREAAKASPIKQSLDIKVYDAVFWYYHLVNDVNESTFRKGLEVMKNTVELDPHYALGWAILGETYVAGYFYGFPCEVSDPIAEGVRCGQKALSIDPRCQHTYQTLGLAYLFQHRKKDCLQIIDQWKKLNSLATGIAGGMGFCLISAGEYEEGYKLLGDSIQINPYYQWWFNAGLSFYYFQKKEYDDALYWAEKIRRQSVLWELLLKAASNAEMGNFTAANTSKEELLQIMPNLSGFLEQILGSFLQSEELIQQLFRALKKIGL